MQPVQEVYSKLNMVFDPELDQSLTELNFIDHVSTDRSNVTVVFRLPTYWCSPNFAYMMAEDIRDRVLELPWVKHVNVQLKDHHASEDINYGVTNRKAFSDSFPGVSSSSELKELRRKFREKAFLARQERLMHHLIKLDFNPKMLLKLTIGEMKKKIDLLYDDLTQSLWQKYLLIRSDMNQSNGDNHPAFTRMNGEPIEPNELESYLSNSKRIRLNMEFNAHQCRGLLAARYNLQKNKEMKI
ncbi:hypothetical protein GCM10011571_34770 [Marinithermofilum abyssi]|uniref:MIP18 family-like domain-containing protein n=1 Tax=Marinithermofilum abyssi TaxID=1571185 RepID=A0A8J2VKS8_9BACL|nr:iron-sulfur cluster assembly protein [Marinithermofilum abyssi]GGE29664.1 hypothetical protein GCM10011571_34770 [Marinithermofilum abyssi]